MGFFKPSNIQVEVSENTYGEDYVSKALRVPSAKEPYATADFDKHFSSRKSETSNNGIPQDKPRTRTKRHGFFTKLFKKTTENDAQEQTVLAKSSNNEIEKDPYTDIIITEGEINSDESSELDLDSSKDKECLKPHKSTISTWRRRRLKNQSNSKEQQPDSTLTKRSTLRWFFRRTKDFDSVEPEAEQAAATSSVYDVRETLTQRYMTTSGEGYDRLMDDLDNLPLELTINEPPTMQQKVSKLLHSLSPLRKSPKSSSQTKDDGSQTELFNPYDIAKNYTKESVTSEDMGEHDVEDNTQNSDTADLSRRPSVFEIFKRTKSLRSKPNVTEQVSDITSEQYAQEQDNPERQSSIRRRISRKLSNRSKKIPSESKFDPIVSDEEESITIKRKLSKRTHLGNTHADETNFGPISNTHVPSEGPFSSDSSPTIVPNESSDIFEKLYSKTLDAAELKNRIENEEDFSGSTKVDVSISDSGELISKPLSGSSMHHNIVANFANVDNENCDSQRISSFLQTYYEPSRPGTKCLSRNASQYVTKSRHSNASNQPAKETSGESRPLTAVEQYNKEVEENRLEMEELKCLIKRNRSHHRKVINGKTDPFYAK